MLIAPIFHNNYLSLRQPVEDVSRINNASTDNSNTAKPINGTSSSSGYNIFKCAFNRGTELLKSTFLSKSANANDIIDLSTPSVSSTHSKDTKGDLNDDDYDSSSSSTSSTPSDASSPDSIKTELMLFKPIVREPRNQTSAKILRIPSIRSTSSTQSIQSPCPSPFFIPIDPHRQSAFSFVTPMLNESGQKKAYSKTITKPKNTKRKAAATTTIASPLKKLEGQPSPKRQKQEKKTTAETGKHQGVQKKSSKNQKKTENISRETRGRKRKNNVEDSKPARSVRKPTTARKNQKESKSPMKVSAADKCDSKKSTQNDFRRITRSMKT